MEQCRMRSIHLPAQKPVRIDRRQAMACRGRHDHPSLHEGIWARQDDQTAIRLTHERLELTGFSANDPEAGPTAPQSIAAQLEHQPTPGSVKRAEEGAEPAAGLMHAERLDARGDRAGCRASPSRRKATIRIPMSSLEAPIEVLVSSSRPWALMCPRRSSPAPTR
jgi:hypothetical protein